MFDSYLNEGILKRAIDNQIIHFTAHDLRNWSTDRYKSVDDTPYGGGAGMLMKIEILHNALEVVKEKYHTDAKKRKIILLSASGKTWNQGLAKEYSELDEVIFICGRFEGVDARIAHFIDEEISIGDYVLTGGELPALIITDSITRLIPGALGNNESPVEESHSEVGVLEHPQYTKPAVFEVNGQKYQVPEVLTNGNHAEIAKWRKTNQKKSSMSKLLSIIIPVYNEEKIIRLSLPAIFSLSINKEVIVINDGSSDNTLNVLQDLAKQYSFKLIDQKINCGKGASVKLGLENISGDFFIVCDADLEYNPQDIICLLSELEKINLNQPNEKIALYGSRFLNKHPQNFHFLVNHFLTSLTNFLFRSKLTDMETCFKLIPKEALKNITLSGRRFEIEPEITTQLLKNNYQILERPISYQARGYKDGKKIKAKDGLLAVYTLFVERFN